MINEKGAFRPLTSYRVDNWLLEPGMTNMRSKIDQEDDDRCRNDEFAKNKRDQTSQEPRKLNTHDCSKIIIETETTKRDVDK